MMVPNWEGDSMGGRGLKRVGALLVVLGLVGVVASTPVSAQPATTIRVVVAYGEYAIEKASVVLQPVAGGAPVSLCTDAEGVVSTPVDAGSYLVSVNGTGYPEPTTPDGSWSVASGSTLDLVVEALHGSPEGCGATPPGVRPAAPSGLTASVVGDEVRLAWTDRSDNEITFDVLRSDFNPVTNRFPSFGLVVTAVQNGTNAVDQVPGPGIYRYRVRAYGLSGVSAEPNPTVTVVIGLSPPAAPSNVAATVDASNIVLTWTDNATDEQYFMLTILTRPQGSSAWSTSYAYMPANSQRAVLPLNDPSTTQIAVRVRARNMAGASADVRAAVAAPARPSFLQATPLQCPNMTSCGAELSFSSATGASGNFVIRYRVRASLKDPWGPFLERPGVVQGTGEIVSLPGPGLYQFALTELAFDGMTRSPYATTAMVRVGV